MGTQHKRLCQYPSTCRPWPVPQDPARIETGPNNATHYLSPETSHKFANTSERKLPPACGRGLHFVHMRPAPPQRPPPPLPPLLQTSQWAPTTLWTCPGSKWWP